MYTMKSPFGSYVRKMRTKQGLTIENLSKAINISKVWISSIENGRMPSGIVIDKLCDALGLCRYTAYAYAYIIPHELEEKIIRSAPESFKKIEAML